MNSIPTTSTRVYPKEDRPCTMIRCHALVPVVLGLLLASTAQGADAASPTAEAIRSDLNAGTGLVAMIGHEDGGLALELAEQDRTLVHMLVASPEARDRLRDRIDDAGETGVVSVTHVDDLRALPYASGLVNVMVVDREALKDRAPTDEQIFRVVAPEGVAWVRDPGGWTKKVRPMPEAMDDWPMPFGDASNNSANDDSLVAPTNTVRWLDGYSDQLFGMGGAGSMLVVSNGVVVHDDTQGQSSERPGAVTNISRLVCRDAHSGIIRWSHEGKGQRLWTAIDGNRLITAYELRGSGRHLTILDIATGKVTGRVALSSEGVRIVNRFGIVRDGKAWVTGLRSLACVDLADGSLLWEKLLPKNSQWFSPSLTPDGRRLLVVTSRDDRRLGNIAMRWPYVTIDEVVCLDPANGEELWRTDELRGRKTLHVPVNNEYAFLCPSAGLGEGKVAPEDKDKSIRERQFGTIEMATGKIGWTKDNTSDGYALQELSGQVTMILGDEAYLLESRKWRAWNLKTGELTQRVDLALLNQRCTRARATKQFLFLGFGAFVDRDKNTYTDQNVARSSCATGPTPAYGSMFFRPSGCGCLAMLRGFSAVQNEPLPEPLPAERRYITSPAKPRAGGKPDPQPQIPTTETRRKGKTTTFILEADTGSLLRHSWVNNQYARMFETEPVKLDDGAELVAVTHEHRLELRDGDQLRWRLVLGGRITNPPVVDGDTAYVAAHDGTVTAVRLADGTVLWQTLVAPARRLHMAYGQLESAWPVHNVVVHDGRVWASAGRHPELDGGIRIVSLDLKTGHERSTQLLHNNTAERWFDLDQRRKPSEGTLNWNTNGRLMVKDGRLLLDGHDDVHGGGNDRWIPRTDPFPIREAKHD